MKSPAEMIMAGDIETGAMPNPGIFWFPPYFDISSTNHWLWPGKSHDGGANMLFCDDHVETARQSVWMFTNFVTRSRWNNDHEPHPETWDR